MEKQENVKVRVTDPQTDATKSFVTYLIIGNDELGTFQIRRRYNDFFFLRQSLKKRWPALYIPPIPQKKINLSKDQQQIEYRRKFFEYFLIQLSKFHHLFYCTITQQFLRNKSSEMEKYYQTVSTPKTVEITKQYMQLFLGLKLTDQPELKNTCNGFYAYLKKAEKQVKVMSAEMNNIAEARQAFLQNLNNCNTVILPEYQKNVYTEYFEGSSREPILLFLQDYKVQDNIRNLRDNSIGKPNSFAQFYDVLVYEIREIQAFQEAIVSRQNIENNKKKLQEKCLNSQSEVSKLMGGKFSIKSIFSKGSKNQQIQLLQRQIPEMIKQIESLGKLVEFTTAVQAQVEIPMFKKNKKRQYYQTLGSTAEKQLQFLGAYGDLMKSVMEGLNNNTIKA